MNDLASILLKGSSATLALGAGLACTINFGNGTATATDPTTDDTTTTDGGDTTSGTTAEATTGSTGAPTTGEPTTGEPTTGEPTTGESPEWCNGFDPAKPADLVLRNAADAIIMDGSALPLVCGGQGSTMLPIYPEFGGFTPVGDAVAFDVVLDVEGYNLGPNNHFFDVEDDSFDVECSVEDTYYEYYGSYNFIPIFAPDAIPDLAVLDGKPGVLHVTLHAPGGDVVVEHDVVIAVDAMDIEYCGYSG